MTDAEERARVRALEDYWKLPDSDDDCQCYSCHYLISHVSVCPPCELKGVFDLDTMEEERWTSRN